VATGPKKKENRGGARPGAGRKPQSVSQSQVKAMLRAARKRAKEAGRTIDDILLDVMYGLDEQTKDKLAAIKIFKDFTMAKQTESTVEHTRRTVGPVCLPERRPDPAKVVPIGKAAAGGQ